MSLRRLLLQRIVLGLTAAWAVLSMTFALFTVTEDWMLDRMLALEAYGGTSSERVEQIREEYLAARGLDRPLIEQYVDWLGNMLTLQWGQSFETGQAVFPTVVDATIRTAAYVLPAVVVATALGLVAGLFVAMTDRSIGGAGLKGLVYLVFGLPNFWLGGMVLAAATGVGIGFRWQSDINWIVVSEMPFVYDYVLPVVLVSTTLLAAVVGYMRAYALQYRSADLTKLVRAKGGGPLAVYRHVLRNAAIPLVSLAFTETLGLLALSVFVTEAVFGIDGLGRVLYNAVWTRDLPMILGGTMVVVAVGVVGNVAQDLAYSRLDPRVDTGTR